MFVCDICLSLTLPTSIWVSIICPTASIDLGRSWSTPRVVDTFWFALEVPFVIHVRSYGRLWRQICISSSVVLKPLSSAHVEFACLSLTVLLWYWNFQIKPNLSWSLVLSRLSRRVPGPRIVQQS